MEWSLDPSLDWSSRPGPAPPSPLETECPSGHPSTDSVSAQDHDESHPAPSSAMDTERPGGQPLIDPVFSRGRGEYCPASSPPLDTGYPDGHPPMDPLFAHGHGEPYLALSPLMDTEFPGQRMSTDRKILHELDVKHFRKVNSLIHHEMFDELLELINIDPQPVNLMDDSVLCLVISAKKTQLAVELIDRVKHAMLRKENIFGDTPLHIAAVEGDTTVAMALLRKDRSLMKAVNRKEETALHKAAMYGQESMFWCLVHVGRRESAMYRKGDGSNMLHCAIMGKAPKLALDIATRFPDLILSRDAAALTPLHLMVTIPNFFRSQLVVGRLESFFYQLIPEENSQSKNARADEEVGGSINIEQSYGGAWKSVRSTFPSLYTTILNLIELIARWFQRVVFNILKSFIPFLQSLEREKKMHATAMKLIECLLAQTDEKGYDFYCKGLGDTPMRTAFELIESQAHKETKKPTLVGTQSPPKVGEQDSLLHQFLIDGPSPEKTGMPISNRWLEPPLIIAAELGLHDLVRKILHLCPESVIYLDSKDRNFVQVAIKSGHKEVVSVISEIFQEKQNPLLHCFLCSVIDVESKNTFLHLAAENDPVEEGDALQLHHQLAWFEMVEKIVPNELRYSRNKEEKTAHELFTKNHKKSLEDCKKQLVELGKACAGLVATVVLTSSFSIPNERDNESGNFAFKIVSHAYMIGFGCAATALVLFLSLILRSYKERDFRRAIPMQFFIACLSFALALGAFYLTVVCNTILQIYGSKMNMKHLIPLILELALYPVVCFTVLLYPGVKIVPSFFRIWK